VYLPRDIIKEVCFLQLAVPVLLTSHYKETLLGLGGWFVLCLFLCITLKTAFNMVAQFGRVNNTTLTDPVMTGIISTPVQLLMAWRIMVVTETRLWTCIIVAIAMLAFGASIWTTIEVSSKPAFSQFTEFRIAPITGLASSATADLIITGVLVYSLHVRKSGYNTSLDTYMNHIIRLTVQTGALSAIFAFSEALVFVILKVFSFSWVLALSNLYFSTILSLYIYFAT
ncbi:hypothetical protein C8J56DRAFT_941356, partial [Mycena floridula]